MSNDDEKCAIDQSVTSHNQSGGITARTVSIQVERRNLTKEAKATIAAELQRLGRGRFEIRVGPGAGNVGPLMEDFVDAFTAGGWELVGTGQVSGSPHGGIDVIIRQPVGEFALRALVIANIPIAQVRRPPPVAEPPPGAPRVGYPDYDVELTIGHG